MIDEAASAGPLDVRADLQLVVDGVSAHISGADGALQVRTDNAGDLTRALLDARKALPGRAGARLAAVTQNLHDAGVSIALVGEHGTVATIGHGQRSPLSAVLPGAPFVRPGRVGVVAPVAWRALRSSTAWPRLRLGAATAVSAITVAVVIGARRARAH